MKVVFLPLTASIWNNLRTRLRGSMTILTKALASLQWKDSPRVWVYSPQSISIFCYLQPVMVVSSKQHCCYVLIKHNSLFQHEWKNSRHKLSTLWLRDALQAFLSNNVCFSLFCFCLKTKKLRICWWDSNVTLWVQCHSAADWFWHLDPASSSHRSPRCCENCK